MQYRHRGRSAIPPALFPTCNQGKSKIPVFNGRGGMIAGLNPRSNKAMLDAADNDDRGRKVQMKNSSLQREVVELLIVDFYQVGLHENFYDELKRYLKSEG